MPAPRFSIVVPLYNKERSVGATLSSCLAQSHDDYEVVVVDDGSTDGSVAVVEGYDSSRIRLLRGANGGVSSARNRGWREARAPWLLFLDADDTLYPEALATYEAALRHTDARLLAARYDYSDRQQASRCADDTTPQRLDNPLKWYLHNLEALHTGSYIVRRDLLERHPFNERYRRYEDLECFCAWLRMGSVALLGATLHTRHLEYGELSAPSANREADYAWNMPFWGVPFYQCCLQGAILRRCWHSYAGQRWQLAWCYGPALAWSLAGRAVELLTRGSVEVVPGVRYGSHTTV